MASLLLSGHARWKAAQGDFHAAFSDAKLQFELAKEMIEQPDMDDFLNGLGVHHLAVDTLQVILKHADGQPAPAMFLPTIDFQRSLQRVLVSLEVKGLERLAGVADESDLFVLANKLRMTDDDGTFFPGSAALYRVFMIPNDIEGYRITIKRNRDLALQPYHQSKAAWQRFQTLAVRRGGAICYSHFPHELLLRGSVAAEARHQVAEAGLMVDTFQARTGRSPQSYDELGQVLETAVPTDPYTGGPLEMRTERERIIIVSLGVDDLLDKGWRHKPGEITFEVEKPMPQQPFSPRLSASARQSSQRPLTSESAFR